jgi:hypothetical protein
MYQANRTDISIGLFADFIYISPIA